MIKKNITTTMRQNILHSFCLINTLNIKLTQHYYTHFTDPQNDFMYPVHPPSIKIKYTFITHNHNNIMHTSVSHDDLMNKIVTGIKSFLL